VIVAACVHTHVKNYCYGSAVFQVFSILEASNSFGQANFCILLCSNCSLSFRCTGYA
jgi:hypothetical protein